MQFADVACALKTQTAIIKNSFSAVFAQSNAAGILNRLSEKKPPHNVLCAAASFQCSFLRFS